LLALLQSSLRVFRGSPWIFLGLGSAVVISLCAVCGGIGLLLAPWFVCELLSLQLEALERSVRPRGREWVLACVVVLGMVLVVASAGWLAALGFGPDVASADSASAPLPWPEALRRVLLIAVALALAVAFTAPFLHAPLVLLSRGGRLGAALLESASLMRQSGALPHLMLSFLAQALCLSPALLSAIVVARTFERAATPLGILAALPLLPLSIPLGLGMVSSAYVQHEPALGDAHLAQQQPSLPLLHRALLITNVVAPLIGLALIGASALLPAGPLPGPAPTGEVVASLTPSASRDASSLRVPDTSLEVSVTSDALRVVSGLEEPLVLPWPAPIEELRVVRLAQRYAIEIRSERWHHVEIDAAGTRVDGSVRQRLIRHLSGWVLLLFLLGFTVVAIGGPIAFAPAGRARIASARGETHLREERRSLHAALAIVPFALLVLASGASVFFGR
jgi:hypothetical protein